MYISTSTTSVKLKRCGSTFCRKRRQEIRQDIGAILWSKICESTYESYILRIADAIIADLIVNYNVQCSNHILWQSIMKAFYNNKKEILISMLCSCWLNLCILHCCECFLFYLFLYKYVTMSYYCCLWSYSVVARSQTNDVKFSLWLLLLHLCQVAYYILCKSLKLYFVLLLLYAISVIFEH